jgi:TolB-like protein/DNA-binding SARP family transcriptional activator
MVWSLKVLGKFAICCDAGSELSLPLKKARALLGYLAVNADKPQRRDRLMTLLWSDRGISQARHSLNQALFAIRKIAEGSGGRFLDSSDEFLMLHSDAIVADLAQFHARLADDPLEAAALYDGPFLDGFAIADPAFEEWLILTRSEIQELACDALERGADAAYRKGDTNAAVAAARRLVALDPLREEGHRQLMNFLHGKGDRIGALRQYLSCADILKRELQIEPDAATKSLFEKIRNNDSVGATVEPQSLVLEPPQFDVAPISPDIPSIAVLPFDNPGGDPAQSFLSDGIAEDIITELSRFRSLFVIARGSSFSFKGQSIDPREIASRLAVRYILEGSVRTHGSHTRVSAKLIDAETGRHIWADRYDRKLEDIFAIQDEITNRIVATIEPEISEVERVRAQRRPPRNTDIWNLHQRGLAGYYTTVADQLEAAIKIFDRINFLDPMFPPAFALAADARLRLMLHFRASEKERFISEAQEKSQSAIALDPRDPICLWSAGRVNIYLGQHDLAISQIEEALSYNLSYAMAHYALGFALRRRCRAEEAIVSFDRAIRLSPHDPYVAGFQSERARALFDLERYEECVEWAHRSIQSRYYRYRSFAILAAALTKLGRVREATAALDRLRVHAPHFTVRFVRDGIASSLNNEADERYNETLRKAGLPEE